MALVRVALAVSVVLGLLIEAGDAFGVSPMGRGGTLRRGAGDIGERKGLKHLGIRIMSSDRQGQEQQMTSDPIISPFDPSVDPLLDNKDEDEDDSSDGPLPLTLDNVEKVLDEMRPYLMSDGGNVRVADIDGGVIRLTLEGACGTCPSSTMTMKMGLERRLREKIPEIVDVVQDMGEQGPELTPESVETVLDTVRPFLKVAGGSITLEDVRGVGGMQPTIILSMTGTSAALRSVKNEIMQRIQRNFMIAGLRIDWKN